ncbi:MAG TPA: lytic murein transglycosylase B [Azospira sp.]|nr:lytic murein transglycosylase B [Azospira sp.]
MTLSFPRLSFLHLSFPKLSLRSLLGALTLGLALPLQAAAAPAPFTGDPDVEAFIASMQERHGFNGDELHQLFAAIAPNDTVLAAIQPSAAAERRSWQTYRNGFVNARRIRRGVAFWQEHQDLVREAEFRFGVPGEIIIAIIGVETEYGRNTGRFGVFQALSTLAFRYPPRAEFFRGELEQLLLLARENSQAPLSLKGSYAGAMGIPQFMPGSQRRFAVDFDSDGRVDLRNSPADAIGSVASFLAAHGWRPGEAIAHHLPPTFVPLPELPPGDLKPRYDAPTLRRLGLPLAANDTKSYALLDLASTEAPTEYWLGEENFFVITRYNRSSFYAMAVFQLGEKLREAMAQPELLSSRVSPGKPEATPGSGSGKSSGKGMKKKAGNPAKAARPAPRREHHTVGNGTHHRA